MQDHLWPFSIDHLIRKRGNACKRAVYNGSGICIQAEVEVGKLKVVIAHINSIGASHGYARQVYPDSIGCRKIGLYELEHELTILIGHRCPKGIARWGFFHYNINEWYRIVRSSFSRGNIHLAAECGIARRLHMLHYVNIELEYFCT